MIDALLRQIAQAQGMIFEWVVQPALYQLGLMDWADDAFDGVEFALFGALAIVLAYVLLRPLEIWRPVEPRAKRWSERRAVRTDIVYTLVNRIGLVPMILFLVLTPIGVVIDGYLRFRGYPAGARTAGAGARRLALRHLSDLCRSDRSRRILAPSFAAPAALVVGVAQPPSRPAPDDAVVGRPQSRVR